MSFVSEIINPFITVRKQVRRNGKWTEEPEVIEQHFMDGGFATTVPPEGRVDVIYNFSRKVILDAFEYGSYAGSDDIYPSLNISSSGSTNQYTNELFHVIMRVERDVPLYEHLQYNISPYLEYMGDYKRGGSHKVVMKQPIELSNGCRLSFVNPSGKKQTVRYKAVWREIGE